MLFLFAGSFLAKDSYSQWQPSWSVGAGLGLGKGINEALSQSFEPEYYVQGLWQNGIAPHLSLEFSISSTINSSPHQGGYSEYSTNLIPIGIRVRYVPLDEGEWQPYIFAGLGLVSYSVTSKSPQSSPDANLKSLTEFIPLGLGIYHPLPGSHLAADFSIAANPSFSDDLNPVRDNRNDAFWGIRIGISYTFGGGSAGGSEPLYADNLDLGVRGTTKILDSVRFDDASVHLKKESEAELDKILSTLEDHPEIEVEFRTYTDDSGDFNSNMSLTHDRAETLKVWFVSRGISASRISTQGYGPHNPLVPNDTPEHRKKNCRVEIVRMK